MQEKDRVEHESPLRTAPVEIAVEMFGGVAMLPTPAALKLAGWPGSSHEAICLARREGRLPVVEIKAGSRFYISAGAFAEAFLAGPPDPAATGGAASATPARRGRGRPRKSVPDEDAA